MLTLLKICPYQNEIQFLIKRILIALKFFDRLVDKKERGNVFISKAFPLFVFN
jgi:hypothetical protein